jgi:hypothetical protein
LRIEEELSFNMESIGRLNPSRLGGTRSVLGLRQKQGKEEKNT